MGHSYDDGWDTKPKLDEARVLSPEAPRRHRARKDRRHWCRGKVGTGHELVYRVSKNNLWWMTRYPDNPHYSGGCGWRQQQRWNRGGSRWEPVPDKWFYRCVHELGCSECGKVLTASWRLPNRDCPDWKPREVV